MAFVNIGGKGEAQIEVAELKDAEGNLEVAVGDRIQAMVVSTAGGLKLSRKLARGAAADRQLEDAFHAGLPVEGQVERREGRLRGAHRPGARLLPLLADRHRSRHGPGEHIGRVYPFRIIEYKEGGKNLIVSRRALLEEEQRANALELRRSIVVGAV